MLDLKIGFYKNIKEFKSEGDDSVYEIMQLLQHSPRSHGNTENDFRNPTTATILVGTFVELNSSGRFSGSEILFPGRNSYSRFLCSVD